MSYDVIRTRRVVIGHPEEIVQSKLTLNQLLHMKDLKDVKIVELIVQRNTRSAPSIMSITELQKRITNDIYLFIHKCMVLHIASHSRTNIIKCEINRKFLDP